MEVLNRERKRAVVRKKADDCRERGRQNFSAEKERKGQKDREIIEGE